MPASNSYAVAADIFPKDLFDEVLEAVGGGPIKVTISSDDSMRTNKHEHLLGDELLARCRKIVRKLGCSRTLYIAKPASYKKSPRVGRPEYARFLRDHGVTVAAAAAALGVSIPTAYKYGASSPEVAINWARLGEEAMSRYETAGRERCNELGIEKSSRARKFFATVGVALKAISKKSEEWDQVLAEKRRKKRKS